MSKELNLKYCTADELADWIVESEKEGFKEFTISGILDDHQIQTVMKAYRIVGYTEGIAKSTEVLMQMPNIEPVRHGKWDAYECGSQFWFKCSLCGNVVFLMKKHNYCPNCGAKMEE